MKIQLLLLKAVIGTSLMGSISTAHAVATLRLTSSDAFQVTVGDGSGLDMSSATGAVNYNGAVGANWVINVSTGLSYPLSGYTTSNGRLDLNSVNVSAGAGSLTLEFSEIGFDSLSQVQGWVSSVGGTLGGGGTGASFFYRVYAGSGLFSHDTLVTDVGTLTGTPFQTSDSGVFGPSASHSLTLEVVINHIGGNTTSFDAETQKQTQTTVPEGGLTFTLLAGAMGGLTLIRRRLWKA